MIWYTYLAKCNDSAIYAGITTDLKRREREHNYNNKLGAKSLRGKRPIHIVYFEKFLSQTEARRREAELKGWKRKYKIELIRQQERQIDDLPGLPGKSIRIIQGR